MTDSLEGLGAELKKAVMKQRIDCQDCGKWNCQTNDHISCYQEVLTAGLVAKEMGKIEKVLKTVLCLNTTFCGKKDKPELTMSGFVKIKNWRCRNCEKVDEVFK